MKKNCREEDRVALVGRHAVREAIVSGRAIHKLLVARESGGSFGELFAMAKKRGIPVQRVERSLLNSMVRGVAHQGIIAVEASACYSSLDDVLAANEKVPFLVLLDEVVDPRNLGAVMRTARAAGVDAVVVPRRRSAGLTPGAVKASAGAHAALPLVRVTNLAQTISHLQKKGIWVTGADPQGKALFWDADLSGPQALVIGGEDKGLGRLLKEKCDTLVSIPMSSGTGSLNVSVAASLLIYEVLRQRRSKGYEWLPDS